MEKSAVDSDNFIMLLIKSERQDLAVFTQMLDPSVHWVCLTDVSEALKYLELHEVAVIISETDIVLAKDGDFITMAKTVQPDSIHILLTEDNQPQASSNAERANDVYACLSPTRTQEQISLIITKAIELFHLNKEKKQLVQELENKLQERTQALTATSTRLEKIQKSHHKTLRDMLGILTTIIEQRIGFPTGHTENIASQARNVAQRMQLSESDAGHIYLCGLLHQIGLIFARDEEVKLARVSSESELSLVSDSFPEAGAKLIGRVEHFKPLADVIRCQDEHYNGTGKPDNLQGDEIPIGARILKVVKDYDFFVASPYNPQRMASRSGQGYLKRQAGEIYDPQVVEVFLAMLRESPQSDEHGFCVGLNEIQPGMVIKRDLYLPNGNLMLTAGSTINAGLISKLRTIEKETSLPIAVYIE
jgi:response regulator RpfG family c-di-GMP phosphodiesterase